ncbi:MAG: hypothetical protein CFE32_20060, partial [Alphaproteobacteria bacterium PA3]
AGLLEQDLEHVELAGRERDLLAGAGHATVEDIHDEIAGFEQIGGGGGGAATAEGFDTGDEFFHREGLGEVVVGAGFEAFDTVADFAAGGQNQDARGARRGAKPGQDGQAVEAGQAQIEDDEIGRRREGGAETLDAVVAGQKDDRWGERVIGIVSRRAGQDQPDDAALKAFLTERLAGYKVPKIVLWVDAVQRSPAGKQDYRWAKEVAAHA